MKCTTCHADNPDRAKFCVECGSAFASRCASCSAELLAGAKFCAECGTKVGNAKPAPAPTPRETPKHLADKIRQSKAAVEGERKQVTVLFADVKGSMELAESLDPEAFSKIMSRFFAILTEGVERFEGFVDKFTGDGIMALFGAPIAHEDHAQRACYAALHLKDEIARYATELKREHGLSFSTRMGLNSGEVVVGSISEDLRMDYTAQGHTVGLAQRMENLAEPNTCFVSANTASLVRGYFDLDDMGKFRVKGVAAPMHVHRLGGIGSSKSRLDVSRARGFSRFVGRGDEMHLLESALTRARQGNAQVIGIVGEAGLGKSRLSFEFLERCRAQNLMTYETTGVAHGKATPLVPVLKLLRGFFGITDEDSPIIARERIAGRLLLLDEKLRDNLALIFDFLGYPDPENPAPKADPEMRQRQMFDVVRRVTQARSQKETQVMLLEDLHWFDGASAAFLEPLIEAAVGTRTLVILNFRPEFQAPWMGKSYYLQLPLGALGSDAIRDMLEALLGKDDSTKGLAEAIHSRTSGNPFFTEEVVQNLIETGKLQGTKGAYRLMTPLTQLEVPTAVHSLLAARIDRLASREKDVLQAASVIGRAFDEPTLAAIVALDAPQLRESLQKLKSAEFVYEQSLYPVTEYLFKHPLTQEVALSSQLQEKRRRLHAAVAGVIEETQALDIDQHAALLSHHWEQAGHALNAATWHRRAALHIAVNNATEAMRHWRSVRAWADKSPDMALAVELGGEAREKILEFAWRLGQAEEADETFTEAESWALAHESKLTLARLHNAYCLVVAMGRGDLRRAVRICEAGLRYASETSDVPTGFMLKLRFGFIQSYMGNVRPTLEALESANDYPLAVKQRASDIVSFDVPATVHGFLGQAYSNLGRLTEGLAILQQGINRARSLGAVETLSWMLTWETEAYYHAGDFAGCVRSASEAMEIARRREDPFTMSWTLTMLSRASLHDGSGIDTAMSQAERALEGARLYLKFMVPMNLCTLALTHLARGRHGDAEALVVEALQLADTHAFYSGGPHPQIAMARIKLSEGSAKGRTEADDWLDRAEEIANATGNLIRMPEILELRGDLAFKKGDAFARESARREALRLYREMGANGHASRLTRELGA